MDQFFEALEKSKNNVVLNVMEQIQYDETADVLEKGKRAQMGEIREWNGLKYQKTPNGWVPVKQQKEAASEKKEPEAEKQEGSEKELEDLKSQLEKQKERVKDAGNLYTGVYYWQYGLKENPKEIARLVEKLGIEGFKKPKAGPVLDAERKKLREIEKQIKKIEEKDNPELQKRREADKKRASLKWKKRMESDDDFDKETFKKYSEILKKQSISSESFDKNPRETLEKFLEKVGDTVFLPSGVNFDKEIYMAFDKSDGRLICGVGGQEFEYDNAYGGEKAAISRAFKALIDFGKEIE